MRHVRESQKSGDLREVQRTLEALQGLRNYLGAEDREALNGLDRWVIVEGVRHKEEAGRRAAMEHLAAVVQRLELERGGGKRNLSELRSASAALDNAWRQVERLRTQVRPDVATKAQRTREALDSDIKHRVQASRRLAFAAVTAVVLICVATAWMANSRQAARIAAGQINAAIADRRVSEVERLLAHNNSSTTPALTQARELGAEFLKREMALKAGADEILATIKLAAENHFTNGPAQNIAADFENARKALAAAAPEFRTAANADFIKKESAWNEFVERERASRSTKLASLLTPLEATAESELQFNLPPEHALRSAERLRKDLEAASRLKEPAVLQPKQEVLFRLETLQARVEKVARDATNWFEASKSLALATNWAGYNSGLQQLISSGFTPGPQREAAAALAALNLSSKTVLAPLLLPHAPASTLLETPPISRVPQNVLSAERDILRRLREDKNIHGISKMQIEVKALPADDPKRKRMVYLRGELQRRITRKSGMIYDPVESPGFLAFAEKEMGSLDYSAEEPTITPERELYTRTGLEGLIDASTGLYQSSLLPALEEINQDRRANPLFRAYLFAQICQVMDAQPAQWGAVWSATLARDRAELNRLGATQIQSGDWMIPAKVAQRGPDLIAHFERTALHSYSREAAFFKRLLPKVIDTGALVVGYVNAEGEAVLNETLTPRPAWGFASTSKPAEIVLNHRSARKPIPFSPLFVFAGDASALVEETLRALSYAPGSVGIPENLPSILRDAP
jgi:hypothetical protein